MSRRPSAPALRVLAHMVGDPERGYYGLELMEACSVSSGTLYPLLGAWRERGWLRHAIEHGEASDLGRSPRTYYFFTPTGNAAANDELDKALSRGWQPAW